jgi:hypothetical protein
MTQPTIATSALAPTRRSRTRRWLARSAAALGGLAMGLVGAEALFYYRDDGAFPHLNVYLPDPELGVRLMPGATEKVAFGGNPVTHVRINREGYRGGELPAPGANDVLVVGDSQVFGLGVEEDETFSAVLAGAVGRPVMNGGVPTYGPAEYRAVIAEQLAKRRPKTVVVAINLVNDLFEVERPNRDRHEVWDGWAVRKETAPAATTSFPGRDLLYRRSHLFFALRKWRHGEERTDDRGVSSEGSWRDIVAAGKRLRGERGAVDEAHRERLAAVTAAHQQIEAAEQEIDDKIRLVLGPTQDVSPLVAARATPGDIVEEDTGAESARSAIATARLIATAAAARKQLRDQLARWAGAHSTDAAKATLAALAASHQALATLTELDVQKLRAMLDPPLGAYLRDVKQLVERGGARLVVVILPMDVQVSAQEWKKYGARPIDMAPSQALTAELVGLCRALGVTVLDATAALAAAEPGAFLDKDIHMTPRGHAAVAAALARTLAEPPPPPPVAHERSPVPLPDVYRLAPEVKVIGSSAANCETKQIREWLRVQCTPTEAAWPIDVEVMRDDGHEAMVLAMPNEISLLVPVVEGRELTAKLVWSDATRVLHAGWPAGAARPTLAVSEPVRRATPEARRPDPMRFRSPTERAICDCWQSVFGGKRYVDGYGQEIFTCRGVYGAADPACVRRYTGEAMCPELLACTRRDPASPP